MILESEASSVTENGVYIYMEHVLLFGRVSFATMTNGRGVTCVMMEAD